MAQENAHESSVATYVIVALVLGVITYIEFAIVEYEIAWLSSFWILFWLVLLSVVKFVLVVMFFMHLKDDDNLYTGFFGSGMIFALGTFVVLALLFTLPATFRYFQAETAAVDPLEQEAAHAEDAGGHGEAHLSEDVLALIASDGYTRTRSELLNTPRPKNQRITLTPPPLADEAEYSLTAAPPLFGAAATTTTEDEDGASDAEDETQTAQTSEAEDDAQGEADAQTEDAAQAETDAAADDTADASWDEALGEETYTANCASCHQANGAGIPGAFPPLAGHMPVLYNAEGGRAFLVDVLLYGLQGQIEVEGQSYSGAMPAWSQLTDEQIAAVLNHELTSWDNLEQLEGFSPITADEVAEQRGAESTAQDVLEQRQELALP